ncbi:MAG: conjugal transfer protein TraF [Vicinamibacterales bacterium]
MGVRAQGMAGAFVALADDSTGTWWNPAGLASGAYFSAALERGRTTEPADPSSRELATRSSIGDFSVAFPALGLSYYRFRISEIAPVSSTADGAADREDLQDSAGRVRSMRVSQYGATLGQSIGDYLSVGSTVKLVRAGVASGPAGEGAALADADALTVPVATRADLDVGAMLRVGRVRIGAAIRNLTEPRFTTGGSSLTLKRQARAGLAVRTRPQGLFEGVTAAADMDLTTSHTIFGDVRHVAGGVEAWLAEGRLGVRAGVSANTIGARRPAGSAGVSLRVSRLVFLNASKTAGRDRSVSGWGASLGLAF